jgi:hypothetical protein
VEQHSRFADKDSALVSRSYESHLPNSRIHQGREA